MPPYIQLLILLSPTFFILTSSSPPINLTLIGSAHFTNTSIILTQQLPVCTSRSYSPTGRILHSYPIRFFNKSSNATVSFSTHFTFTITPPPPPCLSGEGIAFLIASDPTTLPHSDGFIGLPDSHLSDPFLAVEFDTRFNPAHGDINDNHIGLDVNSIVSVAAVDLNSKGVVLKSGRRVSVWIEYRDEEKMIRVWVGYKDSKPDHSVLSVPIDVSVILNEFMYVGFSGSNGRGSSIHSIEKIQFHTFASLDPNVQMETRSSRACLICYPEDPSFKELEAGIRGNNNRKDDRVLELAFGLVLLTACLIIFAGFLMVYCVCLNKREALRRRCLERPQMYRFQETEVPKKLKIADIRSATKGFDPNRVIGQGASAVVYEAHIPSCGNVAVKRFSKASQTGLLGNQFVTELATMVGCLKHKNLVQLQGWCCEGNELVLVYEYMPNGSLDKVIHKRTNNRPLTFEKRLNILLGVASALVYLHEECERQIIHRDVKTCNIMLDADFNAKLGDFGLAEVYEHNARKRDATLPAGTMGCLAPEYVFSGVPSVKTDVYSFGVVVLEVASGQRAVNEDGVVVTDWMWDLWEKRILIAAADPKLMGRYDKVDMERMLMAGLICVHPNDRLRPTMKEAGRMLRGGMVPELPVRKPVVMIQSVMP
ncbi:L-type lectin-domain containing receptor kinase S.6-like [Bidens hawaiensis]|uniref:L-type lectin-domain containing receptor kinase S.6-like n=1 Tax=Bidens hawaiensis TaxID=980011 RepID=UPI00404AA3A3